MASINNIVLLGNVGNVSKVTEFEGEKKVVTFSLATRSGWGEKAVTQWHTCKAWNKTADVVERYVTKGMQVAVVGELVYNTWKDQNGNERKNAEVVVRELQMCGSRADSGSVQQGGSGRPQNQAAQPDYVERDLPF